MARSHCNFRASPNPSRELCESARAVAAPLTSSSVWPSSLASLTPRYMAVGRLLGVVHQPDAGPDVFVTMAKCSLITFSEPYSNISTPHLEPSNPLPQPPAACSIRH